MKRRLGYHAQKKQQSRTCSCLTGPLLAHRNTQQSRTSPPTSLLTFGCQTDKTELRNFEITRYRSSDVEAHADESLHAA